MHAQHLTLVLAISCAMAAPAIMKRDCLDDYNICVATGTPEIVCNCAFARCLGQDNARNREFCATATASSALASSTAFTGICNAAAIARGDCAAPTAPATTTTSIPATSTDTCVSSCITQYNTCRVGTPGMSGNQAACLSEYSNCLGFVPTNSAGSLTTPTACPTTRPATTTAAPAPATTTNPCVSTCLSEYNTCRVGTPGMSGNQAACLAEYSRCLGYVPTNAAGSLTTPTACLATGSQAIPATTTTSTTAEATATAASAVSTAGSGWTIENLIRYCSEDKTGCEYNFRINTNDGVPVSTCSISRTGITDAPTESFYDIPCTSGSAFKISWGYSAQFGADSAFAVLTAVNDQQRAKAYFGISNINGGTVSPSSPLGSGNFGNIGPEAVNLY